MTTPAGYTNTLLTTYGTADFWVLTQLNFECQPAAQSYAMFLTLSGYASASDAMSGCAAMGTYTFFLDLTDINTIFSGAQSLVQAAIIGSSADWADAVYVPPVA